MKIIKNKIIPFGKYTTINLFGVLFTKLNKLDKCIINHEKIHTIQIIELTLLTIAIIFLLNFYFGLSLLYIFLSPLTFYIWYGIEYIIIRFKHNKQNEAYHDISFEEEAHNNEKNLKYLDHRIPFRWIKYLKINKK